MSRISITRRFSLGLLLLLIGSAVGVHAAERQVVRWQTDYLRAHKIRVERRKPMLVFLTMDGCPHCHRMLETTYKDELVAHEIAVSFVPIVINATHQEELANRFGVRVFPTTFIVGADNRILDRMEGYVNAKKMQQHLDDLTLRQASFRFPVRREGGETHGSETTTRPPIR